MILHIMRFRNRNQKWSPQDVYILTQLMRDRVSPSTIAAVLGRSESALRHAIKNTLYQQLLHHMPSDIMDYYQMEDKELYQDVVNPVYYQEVSAQDTSTTTDDEETKDDEDLEDEDSDEDSDENVDADEDELCVTPHFGACEYILTSMTTFLIAGGIAMYVKILVEHWDKLMK